MGVPGKTEGTIFSPIPCDVILSGPERVGGEIIQFTAVEVNGKGLTRKMLVCIVDFLSAIDNQNNCFLFSFQKCQINGELYIDTHYTLICVKSANFVSLLK